MTRLSTWIWKEWHEQRRMFLALLAVVPLGVWSLFATLGTRLEAGNGRELTWMIIQPAVLLLYVLCVATDVFAGERQRGSLSLVQRMPHGLRTAFAVKFVFLLLGAVVLMAWTLCVVASGWWIAGNPIEAWRTLESVTYDRSLMLLPAMLSLFGWIALVSIWLPRGGAAAGAAPILLALLLLPFAWIFNRWPYFHSLEQVLVPVSALVGLTGLAAAWVSWRHGLRFGKSSWRALRFGLPVVLVTSLGAYGYEGVSLNRYLTLDRDDPHLMIDRAWLGRGAKFAFLEVHRGDLHGRDRIGEDGWTPSRPYLLDLGNGDWKPLGEYGGIQFPWVDEAWQRYRVGNGWFPQVDRFLVSDPRQQTGRLIDAVTGRAMDVDPISMKREVWGRPGPHQDLSPFQRLRDGWLVYRRGEAMTAWTKLIVNEDLEEVFVVPERAEVTALGTTCILTRERKKKGAPESERPGWVAHDTVAGTAGPARNAPEAPFTVAELDVGLALLCDSEQGTLERWDPLTGDRHLLDWEGPALTDFRSFQVLGPPHGEELVLMLVRDDPARVEQQKRVGGRVTRPSEWCTVLVDRTTGRVRPLDHWSSNHRRYWSSYVGQDDQGAVWFIEDRQRLVRIGPALGERQVVFP